MNDAKIYMLYSSSKGNSVYIRHGRDEFLIDCGVSARSIEISLRHLGTSLQNLNAIFITHEHTDHIKGLQTIVKHFDMPIYAPKNSCEFISEHALLGENRLNAISTGDLIQLADTAICPISTPHDARGSVGFRIRAGEEKIGYFTDIGHLSEGVLRGLSGCRRVVIESNHDIDMLKGSSYPYSLKQRILGEYGHLPNTLCARLLPHLAKFGTEAFMLAHLSEENNLPELALKTSLDSLTDSGYNVNTDSTDSLRLNVAPARGILELV